MTTTKENLKTQLTTLNNTIAQLLEDKERIEKEVNNLPEETLKEVHPRRYVPEMGGTYFSISGDGTVYSTRWDNDYFDKARLAMGNVYRTEEEAQKVVDKKKLIQELWQEDGVLLEPDWRDGRKIKYFIMYSYSRKKWISNYYFNATLHSELPYFKNQEAVKSMIEKYGERLNVLLK